jgi:hypothetical protein
MILLILTLPNPNMTTKLPEKLTSLACEQFKSGKTEYEKLTKLKTIEIEEMATYVCETNVKNLVTIFLFSTIFPNRILG